MSELTGLTLKAARDGLRARAFSAAELARAHVAAIERHRGLNAFITETPERALAMADASDAPAGRRRGRPARGPAAGDQGPVLHRGRADHRRLAHPGRLRPALRVDGQPQAVGGRRGLPRQDQPRRVRHGLVEHDLLLWRRAQPLDPRRRQRRPGARRQLRRLGGGGGGPAVPGRHRHRHRRLDPPARRLLRHRRHQADLRPLLALGHRRLRELARPGRADGAHGRGLRAPAPGHGRLRPHGQHLGRHAVPDWAGGLTGDVRGLRIGIPKEYSVPGMPAEIDAIWRQGADWLRAQGAELVEVSLPHTKYALPTYYIIAPAEASSNLARYDGMRYGLRVEGGNLAETYMKTRAAGFGPEVQRRDPDRHLRALGRLLRRLLPEGAEGPPPHRRGLQPGVRAGRRAADADRALGRRSAPARRWTTRSRCT